MILKQELRKLKNSAFLFGKTGFGQAEQQCILSVHMLSCLFSNVHITTGCSSERVFYNHSLTSS